MLGDHALMKELD
nr:hypothetical protein [Tanacetum cinerariifolium]